MERFIEFLGDCFFKAIIKFENFFEEKVTKNDTTMIAFLMIPIMLMAIILISINDFIPNNSKSVFITFYPLIGLVILLITAGYYNGVRKRKILGYSFKMINVNFSHIDLRTLGFNESDKYNFKLLFRNRKVKNKINNTNLVKNKSAASYSFLFSLFHVLHRDGLKDLDTIDRQNFFKMLENSFTMNGVPINPGTLESSYSKWNSRLKNDENTLKDLTLIRTVFNIQ
jgi:hypothetical protein